MSTPEEKYLANPHQCPYCDSHGLLANELVHSGPHEMSQNVWCNECGASWDDKYTLTSMKPIQMEEDDGNVYGHIQEQ